MLCCVCKDKEAKVHLTQIANDQVQKVDLCEECAKAKGVNDPTGFSLADLLLGLGTPKEVEQAAGGPDAKCPQCGFTQADFKKAGRFGCAGCYDVFAEGLDSMLKGMHVSTKHIGKVPGSQKHTRELAEKLKSLQKKLDQAVATEDFESAATLRDDIKKMRAQLAQVAA